MTCTRHLAAAAALLLFAEAASAGFVDYVIRNGNGTGNPPVIQGNTTYVPDGTEFIITEGGQKAALGSSDIDGQTLGSISQLAIVRHDDVSRFAPGSGPAVGPYLNFWITDGTHFAVAANEPSNAAFQPLYNDGYDLTFADLADKVVKIYENSDTSWLPNSGVGLTFADLAGFTIQAPSVTDLTAGWPGLGSGAPRELGTNQAYGVNWVFGDTLNNYVSGSSDGYVVSGATVSAAAVPTPGAAALLALGLGLLLRARRRGPARSG